MLDDTSRKVLRILFNHYHFEEFTLDVALVARLSLRTEQQVKDGINTLVKEGNIVWYKEHNTFKLATQRL